jgi:hypothetical protein
MPNSFSIKKLQSEPSQELQDLISLDNLVFETYYTHNLSTAYQQNLLDNPNIIFIVASINFDIVGGLTTYILPSAHYEGSEIYI